MSYSHQDDRLSPRRANNGGSYPAPNHVDPYLSNQPQYNQSTQPAYSQPSQYGQVDSYYSQSSTNINRAPSPGSYNPPRHPEAHEMTPYSNAPLAPTPTYGQQMASMAAGNHMNGNGYNDYHTAPSPSPNHHLQPRPSFSSYQSDYMDETKSYSSTTHLATPKDWEVGSIVPVPPIPSSYLNANGYPPRPGMNPYPDSPGSNFGGTSHWHAMRNQLMERRVVKQIPLSNGNLVMDVPVPKGCRSNTQGLGVEQDEMTSMRYTAATCDPDDFMRNKFTLRPYLYGRKTELFVSDY
jgi:chitin synthase